MSEKKEDKKKKKQSVLEKEIFSIMEKSMKTALDAAVDDLLKDWNKDQNQTIRETASRHKEEPWLACRFFRFLPSAPCGVKKGCPQTDLKAVCGNQSLSW